jgi:DNA repair protein RecO (recombination protein O)
MSRTYKATGINLKSIPLGEADRLLTILTREHGLVKAVAMGARKTNSKLGGRSSLFVVNELLIAKGRSLDKITQAETLESYPGLAQDLQRLTASQYLAELCLCQALSEQPQDELFVVLNQYLKRLEHASADFVLPNLVQAIYHLLLLAGVAPQVQTCCLTRQAIAPNHADPGWRIGFSSSAGGIATLAALEQLQSRSAPSKPTSIQSAQSAPSQSASSQSASHLYPSESAHPTAIALELSSPRHSSPRHSFSSSKKSGFTYRSMTALELTLLQLIAQVELNQEDSSIPELPNLSTFSAPSTVWLSIERILRQYAQYHFDRSIRSAALIDACFAPGSLNAL